MVRNRPSDNLPLRTVSLKNPKLGGLLTSPDDPDGEPLKLNGDSLAHAPWSVPVVDGIPDFVTHAAPMSRTFAIEIPIDDRPSPHIFSPPDLLEKPPAWFKENGYNYRLLKEHAKGMLLDAGCGQGNRSTFQRLGYDYIGLDISPNSKQKQDGPADIDIVADCHRVPLPSQSMEVTMLEAVIEHLYWPMLALKEVQRLLKPGGLLLGSCSFLEAEHFDSQYHLTCLGLYRLLRAAGFDVAHIYPGLSLWEAHANSIFFGIPGHRFLGRLHRRIYLAFVRLKSKESPRWRLFRHAAILHFVAVKV